LNEKLLSIRANIKSGNENLTLLNQNVGYSLLDFWRWSVSDILSNATRGRFAEFVVGTAIDLDVTNLRDEWDAYDLTSKDGIKIEVKSSAYLQSWSQKDFSKISFSIKSVKSLVEIDGETRVKTKRHADVYVFCLLNHKDKETVNPLNLDQWEFYVLSTYKLDNYQRSQSSITLNSLLKLTSKVEYKDLNLEICKAYEDQIIYTIDERTASK